MSTTVTERGRHEPAVVPPRAEHVIRARAGRSLALVAALSIMVGIVTGAALPLLLGAVASLTSAFRKWVPYDVALLLAVGSLTAVSLVVGMTASVVGVDLLARPGVVQALVLVGSVAVAVRGGGMRPAAAVPRSFLRRCSYLPAWIAAVGGVVQMTWDGLAASWALGSSDPAQHVLFLGEIQRTGVLDYAAEAYPRALHMLLALGSAPSARPAGRADLLALDIELYAAATWLSMALVLAAGIGMTHRLCRLLGLSERAAVFAGLLLGVTVLSANATVGTYVYMGAAPALIAIALMWLPAMLCFDRMRVSAPVSLVAMSLLVMVLAHLWQALVVVPPAMLLALAIRSRQSPLGGLALRSSPLVWTGAAAMSAASLMAALPPLTSIQGRGGVELAAIPGDLPSPPWALLMLSLLALTLLVPLRQVAAVRLVFGTALGVVGMTGFLLVGAGGGLDLTAYYPTKGCWYLTVLLAPVLCTAAAAGAPRVVHQFLRLTARAGAGARVVRFGAVSAPLVLGLAWFGPTLIGAPPLLAASMVKPPGAPAVDRTLELAELGAARPGPDVVVPVGIASGKPYSRSGGYVVSKLLSFQTGQVVTFGLPDRVCAEAEKAAGGQAAVVVTDLDAVLLSRLAQQQGCDVRVEQLSGAPRHIVDYQNDVLRGMVDAGG